MCLSTQRASSNSYWLVEPPNRSFPGRLSRKGLGTRNPAHSQWLQYLRQVLSNARSAPRPCGCRLLGVLVIVHVTSDDPPTLLVHGDQDTLVPLSNSTNIVAEFDKQNVTNELIVLEGAEHGFRGEDAVKAAAAIVA